MDVPELKREIARYVERGMPPSADIWPVVRARLEASAPAPPADGMGPAVRRALGLAAAAALTAFLCAGIIHPAWVGEGAAPAYLVAAPHPSATPGPWIVQGCTAPMNGAIGVEDCP